MEHALLRQWYAKPTWVWLLLPLVPLFVAISALRRLYWQWRSKPLPVPVVVVGNITLGGTGKTPVIIALVKHLQQQGYTPGVVSRGYGGHYTTHCFSVSPHTLAHHCGDEPLLIAQACNCPVVVGKNRHLAAEYLLKHFTCNVILSDDGLQHYRLQRQLEIVLLDAARGLGNGWRLPVGPLRESPKRLKHADWVLQNGGQQANSFYIQPTQWRQICNNRAYPLSPPPFNTEGALFAVAGIGHPQRFFNTLSQLNIHSQNHALNDHQPLTLEAVAYADPFPLLMTAKDAIKCQHFAKPNWWALDITAVLPTPFLMAFSQRLAALAPRT